MPKETTDGYLLPGNLVFQDIGMPRMDGYEVASRLRQQPSLENVLLVALTGWAQQADRRRTAEAGFDHHLVKPPEPKAVEGLLNGLKEAKGSRWNEYKASYVCDSCGEEIVVLLDQSAGSEQEYVEDCVCCCPNVVHVEIDEEGDMQVWAERE